MPFYVQDNEKGIMVVPICTIYLVFVLQVGTILHLYFVKCMDSPKIGLTAAEEKDIIFFVSNGSSSAYFVSITTLCR